MKKKRGIPMNNERSACRSRERLQLLCSGALLCALLCVICPWSIPLTPVPVTLGSFAVCLIALAFPLRLSLPAVGGYLFLGAVGVPVFAGWMGGLWKLTSPTGGYLIGYLPMVLCIGLLLPPDTGSARPARRGFLLRIAAALAGNLLLLLFGTLFYVLITGTPFPAALSVCVLPFLPGDALKLAGAALLAPLLTRAAAAVSPKILAGGGRR